MAPATIPLEALSLTLQRSPDGSASDAGRVAVRFDKDLMASIAAPGYDSAFDVSLEPGTWTIGVNAAGYESQQTVVTTDRDRHTTEVIVRCAPTAPQVTSVPVTTSFGPPKAVAVGIQVVMKGPVAVSELISHPSHVWHLAPGTYSVEATAPRFKTTRVSFVAPAVLPVRIELSPEPRRWTAIALSASAGAGIISGSVVAAFYGGGFREEIERLRTATIADDALDSHRRALFYRDPNRHGIRTLGAGAGIGVGALTSLLERRIRRPVPVYIAEAAGGVSFAAVSFGLSWLSRRNLNVALEEEYCSKDSARGNLCKSSDLYDKVENDPLRYLRGEEASNFFAGVGVGLATSSVANLIVSIANRRKASKSFKVSAAGGKLTVRF